MSDAGTTPLTGARPEAPAGAGNHLPGRVRTCDTTGLPVCLTAQPFVKLHAVFAVVFLFLGGIAALLLALTRKFCTSCSCRFRN